MPTTKLSSIIATSGMLLISVLKPVYAEATYKRPVVAAMSISAQSAGLPAARKKAASAASKSLPNSGNLNPVLVQRFVAFRDFIKKTYGVELFIRSGYRDSAEQARLYASRPGGAAVARPGTSQHEKGQAIDYGPYQTWQFNQHLARFGLRLTVPGESWHVEIVEPH